MKYYLKKSRVISFSDINYFEPSYDEELDDISSISSDIYNIFNDCDIEFYLFLDNIKLPINVIAGLGYFIDGFEDYFLFLFTEEKEYMYWIPDQGIETNIYFDKKEDIVIIREFIYLNGEFKRNLSVLRKDAIVFLDQLSIYVNELSPNIGKHPWFVKWEQELRTIICPI